MKFKNIVFLFAGLFTQMCYSQNLVPNPSFEEFDVCPMKLTTTRMEGPVNWYQPGGGSADYFNACAKGRGACSVPKNVIGYQEARSGQAYCGIICYETEKKWKDYREYLETQLTKRLTKGHTYCVRLHMSLAESSKYAIYNMDVVFSRFALKSQTEKCIDSIPSASYVSTEPMDDYNGWTEISMTYTAQGGERFMTFGNFHRDRHTKVSRPRNDSPENEQYIRYNEAYYYIDDVCLEDASDKDSCQCEYMPRVVLKDSARSDSATEVKFEVNKRLVLKNIYFETDKSVLLPASNAELDKLYDFLKQHPDLRIEISGHTDNQGSDEHNQILSEARAKAVVDYLRAKGIPENRTSSKGYGRMQPIAGNDTPEGRQLNRRVEFMISR